MLLPSLLQASYLDTQDPIPPVLMAFIAVMLVGAFVLTLKVFFEVFSFIFNRSVEFPVISKFDLHKTSLSSNQIKMLQKHYPFYQQLSDTSKKIFEQRVSRFISLKQFEGKEGMVITDEVKVLISAAAIQITFGLRDFRFLHFTHFLIYPEKFYSASGKAYHLGETNPKGVIVFSWYDFLKGIAIENDNLNLGLHEFSHALFLNYLSGKKEDLYFESHYEKWKQEGSVQFFDLRDSNQNYIREYAQTNLMEFFAVCVECFFETPKELVFKHPDIYNSIKKLLKQNPAALAS